MGCTKSMPENEPIRRSTIPLPYHDKFQEMMRLNHPLNINNKYTYIIQIIHDKTLGNGIFKTQAYNCKTTRNQLLKKRKQFWETRTTGSQQLWNSIKLAIQTPNQTLARNIINDSGLILVKDSLQMCLDTKLIRYEIPIHCLNDPLNYSNQDLAHKNLNQHFNQHSIKITIRNTNQIDTIIKTNTGVEIKKLKEQYLDGKIVKKIRLFWKGRQLMDDSKLGHYQIQQNSIIQCLII